MDIKILLLLISFKSIHSLGSNEEEKYYEQLIKEGIAEASTYQFPKDASAYRPENTEPEDFGTYDFVIVGGGSAGCVVASRLSEIHNWTVLLLEAGTEESNFTDIPAMSQYSSSKYNWGFNCTPEATCCQAMGGICPFPRGRGLGGTSLINSLVYARGNKLDYDRWASEGNPGWDYDTVLSYFKKSENAKIVGDPGYHGVGGYLDVEYHYPTSKRVDVFLEGNIELGNPLTDVNGKNQLGANRNSFTTINGRRMSSAKAFLRPARNRTNLKIVPKSYVTKVLLTNTSDKAYGVLFSHKNVEYIVKCNKEVIISAGVVGSAQILMLSGIGPSDHLQQVGIPLKKDLAVGERMQDHLTFYNMYFVTPKPERSITMAEAIKQYLKGIGPLTISTNPQGISFFHLGLNNSKQPELEVVLVPFISSDGVPGIRSDLLQGLQDLKLPDLQSTIRDNHVFQIVIVLLHPKSIGNVKLNSSDPYQYPIITCGCLADPNNDDLKNVLKGIQLISKLVDTKAFKKLATVMLPYTPCLTHPQFSEEYWTCVIHQTAMNAYHGIGTCRMGPDPSKGDIVDNKARVHGIPNIRVVDNSIIPTTISGHMNAPAMMIGERTSDFIKEDYGQT